MRLRIWLQRRDVKTKTHDAAAWAASTPAGPGLWQGSVESRNLGVWAGVHFQSDVETGSENGPGVGVAVIERARGTEPSELVLVIESSSVELSDESHPLKLIEERYVWNSCERESTCLNGSAAASIPPDPRVA